MKEQLLKYENKEIKDSIYYEEGTIPILLSSPHTMEQIKEDGNIKLPEPFTKAINMYISNTLDTYSIIKINDTGIDPNSETEEEYKNKILDIIKDNNIKLVIDIHGASINREFDIELGTLNNLSADYSTIKELKEAFIEHGITNIEINNPFKGGGITKTIYGNTNIDVIQIEINRKYRNIENLEKIETLIESIISFIKQYTNVL